MKKQVQSGRPGKKPGGVATRNPKASHDRAPTEESLQKHETLRSKPRQGNRRGYRLPIPAELPGVIGLGLLRRARPRQSDYNANTQTEGLNHQRATVCLANPRLCKVKQSRLRPLSMAAFTRSCMAGFNLITEGGSMQAIDEPQGGLAGVMDHFRQNGMSDHAQNWSSSKDSLPLRRRFSKA